MDPAPPSTAATATTAAAPVAASDATTATTDFTKALEAELQRLQKHATKVETLNNGAKLYHLPGGRLVEAAPGKSPYVVAKGNWKK